ncbi:hypothetical protein Isop_1598 [Isosphaera pallida ATCC 43644]|uniref:Oxidoreductase molybdopterin-binding domain-containing protein n=1 Tax=Isosphaera pallida (strain ATCC 43644 / DSM 9630 / IS1B) TaxID=575540 RepID=E8QZP6_ISOPI|nr:molybdopterin-dependent oxidoreductase [Isosphaera pallida]ADV62182.1 hypothetical protein Isop_1598 [Isosphaera pallida ATCC 43644]
MKIPSRHDLLRQVLLTVSGIVAVTLALAAGKAEGVVWAAAPQAKEEPPATTTIRLQVRGEVATPLDLDAQAWAKLPRHSVEAIDRDGTSGRYEGVALGELLKRAGVPHGETLKGSAMSLCVVVEASDAYRAVFALPELDELFTDRIILVADRKDGEPLVAPAGPLRIVVPGEKRQARWVREVIAIHVVKVEIPE